MDNHRQLTHRLHNAPPQQYPRKLQHTERPKPLSLSKTPSEELFLDSRPTSRMSKTSSLVDIKEELAGMKIQMNQLIHRNLSATKSFVSGDDTQSVIG